MSTVLGGTPDDIIRAAHYPGIDAVVEQCRGVKGAMLEWQTHQLVSLAHAVEPKRVLDIGTYYGHSLACMLAPHGHTRGLSVTTNPEHARHAREHYLNPLFGERAQVLNMSSMGLLDRVDAPRLGDHVPVEPPYDIIFIDGDHHTGVLQDISWWRHVARGGYMVFHDFSPHKFPDVLTAVLALGFERRDVEYKMMVIDEDGVGMAAVQRR